MEEIRAEEKLIFMNIKIVLRRNLITFFLIAFCTGSSEAWEIRREEARPAPVLPKEGKERHVKSGRDSFLAVERGVSFDLFVEQIKDGRKKKLLFKGESLLSGKWFVRHLSSYVPVPDYIESCRLVEGDDEGLKVLLTGRSRLVHQLTGASLPKEKGRPGELLCTLLLKCKYKEGNPVFSLIRSEEQACYQWDSQPLLTAALIKDKEAVLGDAIVFRQGDRVWKCTDREALLDWPCMRLLRAGENCYLRMDSWDRTVYWWNPSPCKPLMQKTNLEMAVQQLSDQMKETLECEGILIDGANDEGLLVSFWGKSGISRKSFHLKTIIFCDGESLVWRKKHFYWVEESK